MRVLRIVFRLTRVTLSSFLLTSHSSMKSGEPLDHGPNQSARHRRNLTKWLNSLVSKTNLEHKGTYSWVYHV